ncbi:MAG: hypothetical protein PF436_13670 [Prolixibacteraceae bacterium]|nr:hypothetical protein [Prolixibacteraceae bacterium]
MVLSKGDFVFKICNDTSKTGSGETFHWRLACASVRDRSGNLALLIQPNAVRYGSIL